jgi:hypothetical protein
MRIIALIMMCLLMSACNLSREGEPTPSATPEAQATVALSPLPAVTQIPATQSLALTQPAILPTSQPILTPIPTAVPSGEAIITTATPTFDTTGLESNMVRDSYPVRAREGQVILVHYSVTLNSAGEVYIYVQGADMHIIDGLIVRETAEDTFEVPVPAAGDYQIFVAFDRLPGTYSLSYGLR